MKGQRCPWPHIPKSKTTKTAANPQRKTKKTQAPAKPKRKSVPKPAAPPVPREEKKKPKRYYEETGERETGGKDEEEGKEDQINDGMYYDGEFYILEINGMT